MGSEGDLFRSFMGLLAATALLIASPTDQFAADPEGELLAPGGDVKKLIEFLDHIRVESARSDEILLSQDFLLQGRRSDISTGWDPELNEQSPETMPTPCWGEFTLIQKEGKRRFEIEVKRCGTEPTSESLKAYRLFNDKGAYKLDRNYLEISGIKNANVAWRALASEYFFLESAGDLSNGLTLAETCESVIGRLKDMSGNSDYWRIHTVRCRRDGELMLIDLERRYPDPDDKYRWHNAFWVDPDRGFRLKKKVMEQRSSSGAIDNREDYRLEHTEISPRLFVVTKAALFVKVAGSNSRKQRTAGWRKFDIIVDDFKTHDFPFDESLFETKSLPVPVGAKVLDNRYDPPRQFIYGKNSLDEE